MNMIEHAVHLMTNAIHPSEAPEVYDGLCSTLNVVHPSVLLVYMMAYAGHLMTNAVHQSEAFEVHDGFCSTPDGQCSTSR